MLSLQLTIDSIALGLFLLFLHCARMRRRLPLPPGPKGWPIFGNIFDMPKEKVHITYMEMGQRYGV